MTKLLPLLLSHLFVVLFFTTFTEGQIVLSNLYVCPKNGTNPVEIPVGTTVGGTTNVTIAMSPTCTLCMLIRISSLTGNLSSLSMQDWNMVPVARSYLNNSWENVAGPYVDKLKITCGSSNCTLAIPQLAGVPAPSHFVLLATNRQVSTKEKVARFLEQVTFGPTLEDINKFNVSRSLNGQFATWVKQQMDSNITVPTYHREYFRARADNPIFQAEATKSNRPRHPCEANSRWRKHSFLKIDGDWEKTLSVTKYNSTSFLLSVEGIPRTVVNFFGGWYDFNSTHLTLGEGNYSLSNWGGIMEYVGGMFIINYENGHLYVKDGNPPLYLPESIINRFNSTIKTLKLPDRQYFQIIEAFDDLIRPGYYLGAGYLSTVKNTDPKCSITAPSMNIIGILPDNEQWYYDARLGLDQNTIDQPLNDGSGTTGILCPNVAKNFLNLDKCTLSTSACTPFTTPNVPIRLNESSLRLLYQGSGRYVYSIRQLRAEVGVVASPCSPGIGHRWMIIYSSSCPTTTGISTDTVNALANVLNNVYPEVVVKRNDVYIDVIGMMSGICDASNTKTIGMMFAALNYAGNTTCYKHIHPDEGNVYDFTYWTRPDTHPGNAVASAGGRLSPIAKWADYNNTFTIPFPSWHTMDRWENNKGKFELIGRFSDDLNFMDLPSMLRTQAVANLFSPKSSITQAVVVCGSQGEVANNSSIPNVFSFANVGLSIWDEHFSLQKATTWNMITLSSQDQLRQRMAWALSQIFVVTSKQISESGLSEAYLNYYDIFVRHAFGSYRDILKEVSQSPMMAEMLSFLESKSSAYALRMMNGRVARPDENFAREVMQLFSIGVHLLNMDGTLKFSASTGLPIPTYRNSDVQTFARAWTGFLRQSDRGNIENWRDQYLNRIDPMTINPSWRDVFPKMDLLGGYIGDSYPLCSDLPKKQFLNIGAKYILLGSSAIPEYQTVDEWWKESWWKANNNVLVSFSLNKTSSSLYAALCNAGADGKCRFQSVVTLNQRLSCKDQECLVDEPRSVLVSDNPPIYYEYIRPACVELTFYSNGRLVRDNSGYVWPGICANPVVDKAYEACCSGCGSWGCDGSFLCLYTGERVLYDTAVNRCTSSSKISNGALCNWTYIDDVFASHGCFVQIPQFVNWHWTNLTCSVQVKVDDLGKMAVVHVPPPLSGSILHDYDLVNNNFFPVTWQTSAFPSPTNNCGSNVCTLQSGSCLCNIAVVDSAVFSARPSVSDVTASLSIGSAPPSWFGSSYTLTESANGVDVYQQNAASSYSMNTIFGVTVNGQAKFYKNMRSMITIGSGSTTFTARNPPHFMSFLVQDRRDAMYETDAVLDHYFYHPNVAPFISKRIIQRFGISNPSPRYIAQAATAFTTGSYTSQGLTFGDGKYGNLGAMVAAIVLDREARSSVLDSDPTFGSMREPMIKLIAFLRAMKLETRSTVKQLSLPFYESSTISQKPHESPNVFSFFLPDYTPSGAIKDASLVSPEAQVHTTPTLVSFLNGIISLVDLGLTKCYGGFGQQTKWDPCVIADPSHYNPSAESEGILTFIPSSSDPIVIVDELALLLTSGRLSRESRKTIISIIANENNFTNRIRLAQKLIAASQTFHTTSLVQPLLSNKPEFQLPLPSGKPYKAVIFVNLAGGLDSYNMLMPKSQCIGAGGKDLFMDYKTVRGELAIDNSTTLPINASSSIMKPQPCRIFGLHPAMTIAQQLYNQKDLVFLANVGVLQEYVNKTTWWSKTTKTNLFDHVIQQEEIALVDIFRKSAGLGVCGRMADVIGDLGYNSGSSSVLGVSKALMSKQTQLFVMDPKGIQKFNPIPWATTNFISQIKQLNKVEQIGSSVYGKTWSDLLLRALGENQLLFDAFDQTKLTTAFSEYNDLSKQFEAVSKAIKNRIVRGVDRDVFYVETGNFDTHADMNTLLGSRAMAINEAFGSFVAEMKAQGRWDDVVVVFVSEFARTLVPNTSGGSDHAWGGNYWVAGGSVDGGKVLGEYINDFTENSPLMAGSSGIVIPTTSWDQVWEPIVRWYGITKESDLDYVLPSRKNFVGPLTGIFP